MAGIDFNQLTNRHGSYSLHPKRALWARQILTLLLAAAVAACGSSGTAQRGEVGFVEGFLGGVVADEPLAAQIGREILSRGGSAADAAVAIGITLSVTYPAAASLGGGGVCVVHDKGSNKTETIDFLARAPRSIPQSATRPTAVPGNPRGFFALHSRYGRLDWSQLLAPAEQLARFGNVVSRSLARTLATVGPALLQDMDSRRIFINPNGNKVIGEGDKLVQVDLAAMLGNLRRRGPGEFYSGQMAQRLVTAVNEVGGSLSLNDLRNMRPEWRETVKMPIGNHILHFAPPPADAGTVEAELISILTRIKSYADAPEAERPHLLIESFKRVFADRVRRQNATAIPIDRLAETHHRQIMANYRPNAQTPANQVGLPARLPPENPAATSFVTIDRSGSAVACGLTMNNIFGIGRVARGTGIMLAATPGQYGGGPASLGPVILVNPNSKLTYLAAGSSGGATASTSLVQVLLGVLVEKQPLEDVINRKRVHHGGRPDLAYFEQGLDANKIQSLTQRGHRVAATPSLGQVNAIYCDQGLPYDAETKTDICAMRADPRGAGIALSAD
jgi:gamma-glutamyltranspeptidase/glutathione hydrolase